MKKITLIGGDIRIKILKQRLEEAGYTTDTLGLFENDAADLKTSDAVIMPVPTTKDRKTVFTPLTKRNIFLSDISEAVSDRTPILCCNYSFYGKNSIDYGSLDGYSLLNAVPTAEGAIKLAIEQTPFTLWKSRVLVIGYGRVGKILADRLAKLGCRVTVSARKTADFCMLDALGFEYMNTCDLNKSGLPFDIIFNTVDVHVIDDEVWQNSECTLAVDLSSLGGFSLSAAEKAGIRAVKAPGLPGIVAPHTAADILFKTVKEILEKW